MAEQYPLYDSGRVPKLQSKTDVIFIKFDPKAKLDLISKAERLTIRNHLLCLPQVTVNWISIHSQRDKNQVVI